MTTIYVNNKTVECDDVALAVKGAIETFASVDFVTGIYTPPDLETVRDWALSHLNTWRGKQRISQGLTEAMYYEALRWQDNPASRLVLNPGRMSNEDYTAQVISRWDKIEVDYNLSVSLVNQAQDTDTIAVILSRRS